MKAKLRLLCSVFVIIYCASVEAQSPSPAFHYVVTGGLMGVSDGNRAFFNSPLFRLKSTSKSGERFVIADANRRAFRFKDTVFLANKVVSSAHLFKVGEHKASGLTKGFMGAQLFAIGASVDSMIPHDLVAEELTRELGAVGLSLAWEIRVIDGVEVLAIASSPKGLKVEWPKANDDLDDVLVVRGKFGSDRGAREYLFFPRQVASTDRVFGTIDNILKTDANAQYIDLGDTLFGPDVEDVEMARKLQTLMVKRNPAVMGASWHDFRAFWIDARLMQNAPYIAALMGKEVLPSVRRVENKKGVESIFAALPSNSPLLEMVLPKGTEPLTFEAAIERVKSIGRKAGSAFVVGLSQDAHSATRAVESPVFDAMLSLVSAKGGALPSYDEIDLSQNRRDGLRSVSPLIRVSPVDVTEVSGYLDETGALTKLIIRRHAIVDDGAIATDAASVLADHERKNDLLMPGLPKSASLELSKSHYAESELNAILGGLLLKIQSGTEIAIVEQHDAVTPIESPIPLRLTETLLNDRGRAVWLEIRGKYLKRLFKAIKEDQKGGKTNHFGLAVSVVGGKISDATVGQREISDAEDYKLVVSERVFFAIDRFMSRESLFAMKSLPSSGLQTALFEGGKETLKILAEIRKRDARDNPDIGETRALFAASFPIADLIEEPLEKGLYANDVKGFIRDAGGLIKPTLIIDISDLDLGFKFNATNATLEEWQDQARKGENGGNSGFNEPRFFESNYNQKLIYAKVNVTYITSLLDVNLGANIKFFQPNPENNTDKHGHPIPVTKADIPKIRPAKDSVRIESELRFPFRRMMESPPAAFMDLAPIARFTYETQLWPATWLTSLPVEDWPVRVNDVRALLGLSAKPLGSEEIVRAGALFDYDISRATPEQAFGYGYEVAGQGKWNVGFISLKLETSVRQLFPIVEPEKSRLGLIWLVDGKVEVPIYGGFSLSMLANTTFGTRMHEPLKPGYGVLFAFAISYSDRLKWLF